MNKDYGKRKQNQGVMKPKTLDQKKNHFLINFQKFFNFFVYPICISISLILLFSSLILLKKKFDINLDKDYLFYLTISTILISICFARSFKKYFDIDREDKEIKKNEHQSQLFHFMGFLNTGIHYVKAFF